MRIAALARLRCYWPGMLIKLSPSRNQPARSKMHSGTCVRSATWKCSKAKLKNYCQRWEVTLTDLLSTPHELDVSKLYSTHLCDTLWIGLCMFHANLLPLRAT